MFQVLVKTIQASQQLRGQLMCTERKWGFGEIGPLPEGTLCAPVSL